MVGKQGVCAVEIGGFPLESCGSTFSEGQVLLRPRSKIVYTSILVFCYL